jgi:hypothetical protein
MSELKTCPFCGSDGYLMLPTCNIHSAYDPNDRAYPVIHCKGCYTLCPGDNWDHSGDSAVTRWNTRTGDTK